MAANWARKFFARRPLLANAAVYGTFYVGAELSQQVITKKLSVSPDSSFPPRPGGSRFGPRFPEVRLLFFQVRRGAEENLDVPALARYLIVGSLINSNYLFAWSVFFSCIIVFLPSLTAYYRKSWQILAKYLGLNHSSRFTFSFIFSLDRTDQCKYSSCDRCLGHACSRDCLR